MLILTRRARLGHTRQPARPTSHHGPPPLPTKANGKALASHTTVGASSTLPGRWTPSGPLTDARSVRVRRRQGQGSPGFRVRVAQAGHWTRAGLGQQHWVWDRLGLDLVPVTTWPSSSPGTHHVVSFLSRRRRQPTVVHRAYALDVIAFITFIVIVIVVCPSSSFSFFRPDYRRRRRAFRPVVTVVVIVGVTATPSSAYRRPGGRARRASRRLHRHRAPCPFPAFPCLVTVVDCPDLRHRSSSGFITSCRRHVVVLFIVMPIVVVPSSFIAPASSSSSLIIVIAPSGHRRRFIVVVVRRRTLAVRVRRRTARRQSAILYDNLLSLLSVRLQPST